MVFRLPESCWNWNLEMLVFEEEKTGVPGEKPLINIHMWRRRRDMNPGHIGGRRVLSPLRHPNFLK